MCNVIAQYAFGLGTSVKGYVIMKLLFHNIE